MNSTAFGPSDPEIEQDEPIDESRSEAKDPERPPDVWLASRGGMSRFGASN